MCYTFYLGPGQSQHQCSTIVLSLSSSGTWLVEDLLSPSGASLGDALAAYPYGP
jgi:hypothetical protein